MLSVCIVLVKCTIRNRLEPINLDLCLKIRFIPSVATQNLREEIWSDFTDYSVSQTVAFPSWFIAYVLKIFFS